MYWENLIKYIFMQLNSNQEEKTINKEALNLWKLIEFHFDLLKTNQNFGQSKT